MKVMPGMVHLRWQIFFIKKGGRSWSARGWVAGGSALPGLFLDHLLTKGKGDVTVVEHQSRDRFSPPGFK